MSHPRDEETDRAVSRRVEHPTSADAADERAYAAADPAPEEDPGAAPGATGGLAAAPHEGGDGGAASAADVDAHEDDEPTRSE